MQTVALLFLIMVPSTISGQNQETFRTGVVVDKMVATLNGELITYSDLMWQLALQPDASLDNPKSDDLRRALERTIDQRLIMQDAEKLPTISPTDEEISSALTDLIKHFPSRIEFERRANRVGLSGDQLKEIVRRRVAVEKYLDFRFRAFIVVTQKEIAGYYQNVYVPRLRRVSPGRIVPTIDEAQGEIEKTLTEDKIQSAISKFLDDAHERAEVIILNPV